MMRWEGRRESENVEDRRRMAGPVAAVAGGGLIVTVLTVVIALMGGDPRPLLQRFCLDFSGKGEVRFRSFDLGTGRWIFAGIRSCVP